MFSEVDRLRAIELYFKYGRKVAPVVRELGWPSEKQPRRWVTAWEASGGSVRRMRRKTRYTDAQKQAAVDPYLSHGCCLAFTRRTLGYPCSTVLIRWVDEMYPGRRRVITGTKNGDAPFAPEIKRQAAINLCIRLRPAREIAQEVGVSRQQMEADILKKAEEIIKKDPASALKP